MCLFFPPIINNSKKDRLLLNFFLLLKAATDVYPYHSFMNNGYEYQLHFEKNIPIKRETSATTIVLDNVNGLTLPASSFGTSFTAALVPTSSVVLDPIFEALPMRFLNSYTSLEIFSCYF
jgi:hypothetical protein